MKIKAPEKITQSISPRKIFYDEPMKRHTSVGTGGNAAVLIAPDTIQELCFIIGELRTFKNHVVIGGGNNVLVSDKGYNGIVIKTSNIKGIDRYGRYITALSGDTLHDISNTALKEGLTGMEWAVIDTGTLGAAIMSNASHYGAEIWDSLYIAEVVTKLGEVQVLQRNELEAYGRKNFLTKTGFTVLRAILRLEKGDVKLMGEQMEDCRAEFAGITDKPAVCEVFSSAKTGESAASLIKASGANKISVGGASVCPKNANCILNNGGATSNDVYGLINGITMRVLDKKGIQLKHCMRLIGRF